ncbi:DUF389 domain-containing protein [Neisseria shayeganii]|uniref:Integral membrane protein n=1 Tax=Neisseria shayeganii 871 TaxID=1032488 RepID=G4CFP0_9NEIS|nr:DUF389 domain-containing protein [Neisseria shayeganii]EGY53351.1 hypothetical protein HMPREF9371_0460 [Neisseria shayeganii 871]
MNTTSEKEKEVAPPSPLHELFSLHHDQAHADKVDAAIRNNVRVSGTNLWVLMFAIAIASIGLNVNSTAVIIGAMLISPLMGPIVGMGYGAAVGDVRLIRLAARNMMVFILISLLTATLYFLITPLEQAQSELLARTQPTLWDVLIAFFGGSAGIVAITRKDGGNVIPGVAIATALMPPLCTAGFGLAHGNWGYFFGAFYLFAINCVFIAFATLIFSRLLKLPRRGLVTESTRRVHRAVILLVVVAVMLPSSYLAMRLVQKEIFNTNVASVVKAAQQEEGFFVLRSHTDDRQKLVRLIINGVGNAEQISQRLHQKLEAAGIREPQVQVVYAGGDSGNLDAVRKEIEASQNDSLRLQDQLKQQADYIHTLQTSLNEQSQNEAAVLKEIRAQYPEVRQLAVGRGVMWEEAEQTTAASDAVAASAPEVQEAEQAVFVWMLLPEPLSEKEAQRLSAWLSQRMEGEKVRLVVKSVTER